MLRRVRSRVSLWLVAALVACLGLPFSATAAPPVPTYFIEVSAATMPYGTAPVFVFRPVYAELPAGSTLTGKATCARVFTPGEIGATQSVYGTGGSPLHPGSYDFVQSSCQNDPGFPLALSGLSPSNYDLQIVAGSYTVEKAPTAIGGTGIQGAIKDGVPTPTLLTAVVFDAAVENTQLEGKTVTFDIQLSNGVFLRNVCTAVTTENEAGDLIAICRLTDQYAKALYDSAGRWTARFAGDAVYGGSSVVSTVSGQLTPAEVAANLNRIANENSVTLVQEFVPPECDDNPYRNTSDNSSIIALSLGTLDCDQLMALQITTTIVFAIATSVIGGEAYYVAQSVNAARNSLNALKAAQYAAELLVLH